jgi:hypothetical protein
MSNFYNDTLLKEEFTLLQQVQRDREVSRYMTISYEDQLTGSERNISLVPSNGLYPEKFFVKYRLPVYIAQGQRRDDFEAVTEITINENVLKSKNSDNGPHTVYSSNFEPFNNHVHKGWICTGNAWMVAKDHGVWYYILALGALINQDGIVTDHERRQHINPEAFDYWVERGKRPVTQIKWPWDMTMKGEIVIKPTTKPQLTIKKVGSENQGGVVNKIPIVKKSTDSSASEPMKISIIKK